MHHGDVSPQIAQGLLALKKRITAADIPSSKLDETINVAVWNARAEFSFQLSDHFPVWVQINTGIDGERFNQIVQDAKKG